MGNGTEKYEYPYFSNDDPSPDIFQGSDLLSISNIKNLIGSCLK